MSSEQGARATHSTARAPIRNNFIVLLTLALRVIGFPLLVFYFLYRGWRDPRYLRSIGERLGTLPAHFKRTAPGSIWLHAVSVGEVITGARLIEELRRENPQIPIYLSTTTIAGQAVAEQKMASLCNGIFFAPIDYGFAVRRVLGTIRPAVVVILETEIWPVLYRQAKLARCELLVVNGRISDRAFPRYRRLRWFFQAVLQLPDAILVQSELDKSRYIAAGATPQRVRALGNLKYDAAPVRAEVAPVIQQWLAQLRPTKIWVAASTMPGAHAQDIDEDDAVLAAYREIAARQHGLLLILVPRRPERFALAAEKLRAAAIPFFQRSCNELPPEMKLPGVLLLDTMGELASFFPRADVVFMGGTLARRGGHNVLEPASCGKPIVVGPHMENFAEIADNFREQQAWMQIDGPRELPSAVLRLLENPVQAAEMGRRAAQLAAMNTGVAERASAQILAAQDRAIPVWDRPGPANILLWPLAKIWEWASQRKQRRDTTAARALDKPVISVGGIAMGGSGKTPFVEVLVRKFREEQMQPAILTRGYRRRSPDRAIVIPAGQGVSTWYTGDEAQIFVRSGLAHLGIGPDRYATGRLLLESCPTDVFLLDDGFQHLRLRRNVDIVLIDALDPFPGGGVFPLGRLREPLSALQRADIFVITRAKPGREYAGIRAVLREHNPHAPVFLAGVAPRVWIQESTGTAADLHPGPVGAFCGLGNPATFWQSLRDLGFDPVFTWTFGDHHHYRPQELKRLALQAKANGAAMLLTTEKDAMNLPEGPRNLIAPLEIYWLKIVTVVEREEEFMALLRQYLPDMSAAGKS